MAIKRKLIKTGYSLLICIPKHWVEMQGLKRGDTVFLETDQQGNLIIKKEYNLHEIEMFKESLKKELDNIDMFKETLRKELDHC